MAIIKTTSTPSPPGAEPRDAGITALPSRHFCKSLILLHFRQEVIHMPNFRDIQQLAERLYWRAMLLPDDESVQFRLPSGRLTAIYSFDDAYRMLSQSRAA